MQEVFTNCEKVVVENPYNGKMVNVRPLFELLQTLDPANTTTQGFEFVGELLDENVIRFINENWVPSECMTEKNQDMFFLLYQLRDLFQQMKVNQD